MANPVTHDDLVRKSRGTTSAHRRSASIERDLDDVKGNLSDLSTSLALVERTASKVPGLSDEVKKIRTELTDAIRGNAVKPGSVDTKAIEALKAKVDKAIGDVASFDDRLNGHDARIGVVEDRIGVVERNPALGIDFENSTNVSFRGRVESQVNWGVALVVGAVVGLVFGLLASMFCYDLEWEWSLSKSIVAGVIIGLATFLFFASFERLAVRGVGKITWAQRPTMQEEVDQLDADELQRQLSQLPDSTDSRTTVQQSVPQNVRT